MSKSTGHQTARKSQNGLSFRQQLLAVPAIVRVPTALLFLSLGAGLGIYWWITYSGLYRWLIEAQNNVLGRYLPVYTGMLTVVLTGFLSALPAILFLYLLARLGTFRIKDASVLKANDHSTGAQTAVLDVWLNRNKGKVAGIVLGSISVIFGLIWTIRGAGGGTLQTVNLADLEAGKTPLSNYVQTHGRLLTDRMMIETTQNIHKSYYVPIVSEKWREGGPVTVYVSVTSTNIDETGRGPVQGMLWKNGLPGPIRTAFEANPKARPAQPHYLLKVGNKPETWVELGRMFLGVGLFTLLATGVVWIIQLRRSYRCQGIGES